MAGSQRLLALLPVLLATALFAEFLTPFPVGAVLPPGANESLASKAPHILIGRVIQRENESGRELAVFKILGVLRGELNKGDSLKVELAQRPQKRRIGPSVVYHEMEPGQTWLVFLLPPEGKVVPYHTLAAHGWYTQRLDGICDAKTMIGHLPRSDNPAMAEPLQKVREIYQTAGEWLERNSK